MIRDRHMTETAQMLLRGLVVCVLVLVLVPVVAP